MREHYGADLSRIHHDHFGMVARAAARELLTRLSKAGISSGMVVDLASYLVLDEEEDGPRRCLTRAITLFVPEGNLYRRVVETHLLRLYTPNEVETLLTRMGFGWERLHGYDHFELSPGWHATQLFGGRSEMAFAISDSPRRL